MQEFVRAMATSVLLRNALLAGLLVSLACGVVGSFVVARRITYLAGAIAHFVLGGMGVVKYVSVTRGWDWLHPLHGAVVSALLAAVIIGLVGIRARQREDTVIGALWAIGMAVGILFISRTPGYNEDLMSYLFGDILMISPRELLLVGFLDALVIAASALFYSRLLALCFDEEFARLRNVRVEAYYMLLLGLTALTVVLLVTVVGVVLTIALLTLPAATAGQFTGTLRRMMAAAVVLCALVTTGGLAASWSPGLPAGATIVVLAGGGYLAAAAAGALGRRLSAARRAAQAGK